MQNGAQSITQSGTQSNGTQNGTQSQSDKQRETAEGIARKKVLAAYGYVNESAPNAGATGGNAGGMVMTGVATGNIAASADADVSARSGERLKDQPVALRANSEDWRKYHSAWQNYYQKYYSEYYANAARNYVERERLRDARRRAEEEDALESFGRTGSLRSRIENRSRATANNRAATNNRAETNDRAAAGTKPANAEPAQAEPANAGQIGAKTADESAYAAPATSGVGAIISSGAEPDENDEVDNIGAKLKQTIRKKAMKNVKQSRRRRKWIPLALGVFVVLFILFMQYNRLIFAPIFAYMSPGSAPATEIEAIDPTITQAVSADPRLLIPKLNVDVPIHFGLQLDDVMSAMNSGVAHYRIAGASAYPGEVGNTVITGHSAGDIYSSNPYKYIFSGLERLEEGDLIYVNYKSVRYTYQVRKKQVVEPTNVAALVIDTDVPMLTLVTCTPLGTSRYRLLVFAEQISPNPEEAEESEEPEEAPAPNTNSDEDALPSNEPSFFEGIWNFLTGR